MLFMKENIIDAFTALPISLEFSIEVTKREAERTRGNPRRALENNVEMCPRGIGCVCVDLIHLA
jgi:hypothetical protein